MTFMMEKHVRDPHTGRTVGWVHVLDDRVYAWHKGEGEIQARSWADALAFARLGVRLAPRRATDPDAPERVAE